MAFLVSLAHCKMCFVRAQYHQAYCLPRFNLFLFDEHIISLVYYASERYSPAKPKLYLLSKFR